MRHASLNGYLFLTNGIDPLMYYDGTNFYKVENNSVSTTLSASITTSTFVIPVTSTAGFNPTSGFIMIGSEIIQYTSTTSTSFICSSDGTIMESGRGYALTPAQAFSSGATVNVYFGTPPVTPKYIWNFKNRLFTGNENIPGGTSLLHWSSGFGQTTDGLNWMQVAASTVTANGSTFTGNINGGWSFWSPIAADDGQVITALSQCKGMMLVEKNQSSYLATFNQDGSLGGYTDLSRQYGTHSQESMVDIDSTIFMFNQFGVISTDTTKPVLMSYQINDLATGVPTANLSSIYGVKHNFTLMFAVGSTTESTRFGGNTYSNVVLVFNYLTQHWYMWQYPFSINCYSEMFDSNGTLQLYYGDTTGASI